MYILYSIIIVPLDFWVANGYLWAAYQTTQPIEFRTLGNSHDRAGAPCGAMGPSKLGTRPAPVFSADLLRWGPRSGQYQVSNFRLYIQYLIYHDLSTLYLSNLSKYVAFYPL